MSQWLDDVARAVARPLSRREALRLLGGTMVATLFGGSLARRADAGGGPPCDNDPSYPHECGDLCCRYDYYCASATILNGGDTHGICCRNEPEQYQYCNDGTYGWCCSPEATCGVDRYVCDEPEQCTGNQEECGDACCDSAAGEICCDPDLGLCCAAGVTCCFDAAGNGTCCSEGTTCVPISPTGDPPGFVCCPDDQACIGQCCPAGEVCVGNLICCPEESATPNRDGCCNPGFVYIDGGCCSEGRVCAGVCCPYGQVCNGGQCQPCSDSQELCFDVCCDPGTCCLGKCCAPGEVCTGECTVLETLDTQVTASAGGSLSSSNNAVTVNFPQGATTETLTLMYTSHADATLPLPPGTSLLRSFTLEAENASGQEVSQFNQAYTMLLSFDESTLAALNVGSESALDVLWWNGSSWVSMLPCAGCYASRTDDEVVVRADHFTDFVLVVRQYGTFMPVIQG